MIYTACLWLEVAVAGRSCCNKDIFCLAEGGTAADGGADGAKKEKKKSKKKEKKEKKG